MLVYYMTARSVIDQFLRAWLIFYLYVCSKQRSKGDTTSGGTDGLAPPYFLPYTPASGTYAGITWTAWNGSYRFIEERSGEGTCCAFYMEGSWIGRLSLLRGRPIDELFWVDCIGMQSRYADSTRKGSECKQFLKMLERNQRKISTLLFQTGVFSLYRQVSSSIESRYECWS